jgi:hypothetical protein
MMMPEENNLTGDDLDMMEYQAEVEGDEAIGGTAPTPDNDIVDDIAAAVGVEIPDRSSIRVTDMLESRDDRRFELDPESAEDYEER